jgi:NADPH:quinone reductase-like Zn-dependent oxidoreductase
VRATSLNYRDFMVIEGHYNPRQRLPLIPIADGAGEVAAVGDGVTRVRVGDRVTWAYAQRWFGGRLTLDALASSLGGQPVTAEASREGALAEYVVIDEDGAVRFPEHLSFEEAATLPCAGVTAWHALFGRDPVRAGDTVLVQGTGGVAVFAIQLARAAGARVIVTSSSDEKLVRAREIGAHEGINYKTTPAWDERALALTGGVGVDRVIDVTGGEVGRSLNALRMGGQVSVIGILSGITSSLDILPLLTKNASIQGIFVGDRGMFEDMNRAIAQHRIRPVVDRTYQFDQAKEAIAALGGGGSYVGKLVIQGA